MRRALAALAATLLLAPSALAADPGSLLSGYGAPGDGEQALLGQTLIVGSGGKRAPGPATIYQGTAGASAAAGAAANVPAGTGTGSSAAAPAASGAPAPAARVPRRGRTRPAAPSPGRRRSPSPAPSSPQAARPVPVRPVAAPAPFAGSDWLLLAAVLAGAVALALVARRLAVRSARARRPVPLQAP